MRRVSSVEIGDTASLKQPATVIVATNIGAVNTIAELIESEEITAVVANAVDISSVATDMTSVKDVSANMAIVTEVVTRLPALSTYLDAIKVVESDMTSIVLQVTTEQVKTQQLMNSLHPMA